MEIAKLTSKGQLTLPVSVRRQLGLDTGDRVAFIEKDGEITLVCLDRVTVSSKKKPNANIENVIASMNIEGLEVSDESIRYMNDRLNGKLSVEERIAQIRRKYVKG